MKLKIVSSDNALAIEVGANLEAASCKVSLDNASGGYHFWVRDGLSLGETQAIRKAIAPFDPPVATDATLADNGLDALLCLGFESDVSFSRFDIPIACAAQDVAADIADELHRIGFSAKLIEPAWPEQDIVSFGSDVPLFLRHRILWLLRQRDISPRQASGGVSNNAIGLVLRTSCAVAQAKRLFPVVVHCDDPTVMAHLQAEGLAGFKVVPSLKQPKSRFQLGLGPLRSPEFAAERVALEHAILEILKADGVDLGRHPLKIKASKDLDIPVVAKCELHLPIAAWRNQQLRPYTGDSPDRFDIELLTDCAEAVAPLAAQLQTQGFTVVERPLPVAEASAGFQVIWAMAELCPQQKQRIGDTLRLFIQGNTLPAGYRLVEHKGEAKEAVVRIKLPMGAALAGTLPDRRGAGYDFKLNCEQPEGWEETLGTLRTWGFDEFQTDTSAPMSIKMGRGATIRYGGAPRDLLEEIANLFRQEGIAIKLEKDWSDHDNDIWVEVDTHPSHVAGKKPEPKPVSLLAASKLPLPPPDVQLGKAIEVGGDVVRLGAYRLPSRADVPLDHPLLIDVDTKSFCLDTPTLATLEHLAASVHLREPVLLEGDTSTSKTSSILYLAKMLNQPVIRLNLNGQTDTGELIGRYVPAESGGWRWEDGAVPKAMRQGYWLLMDEVNLAEPQVLERLNPIMERSPSLLMSEHDGSLLAGEDVHADFRVLATMNPAEFAGRSTLSPAWRDRFGGYRFCPVPDEQDYLAMLRYWVAGEQPAVLMGGAWVRGDSCGTPPYGALAELPGIDGALLSLARFHMSMIGVSGRDGDSAAKLGARRKERHVFTRRGLFLVLDFLVDQLAKTAAEAFSLGNAIEQAITRYYVNRMDSPADRETVRALQEANGLTAVLIVQAQQRAAQAEAHALHSQRARLVATLKARAEQLQGDEDAASDREAA
ncbi:AAA family ATPase [Candidatus Symbiobacter mobilis]|uniref:Nitric oxide reductase-like protein n=1 Tax=Candidatus Symbiobacter mobilis CR TaxID=946483 RepID=U5N8M2_9BURK|nr:AAA family ATPase [Candidatus Symbiobacter mobilis]AGX87752.1 nitric oxide reductase-like protein [Candidatus Symbiobacter mobilis CR]